MKPESKKKTTANIPAQKKVATKTAVSTKETPEKMVTKKTAANVKETTAKMAAEKPSVSTKEAPVKKVAKKTPVKASATEKTTAKPGETTAGKVVKKSAATPKPQTPSINITSEERWKMIATAAYHKAERRGFAPGSESQDWAEAEQEIDELLKSR